jgi:hypothetical protein
MAFLAQLKSSPTKLKALEEDCKSDRSAANLSLAGSDVLDDEHERWQYFFDSGVSSWYNDIRTLTFTSTFCDLSPAEAQIIVNHWEARQRILADLTSRGMILSSDETGKENNKLYQVAASKLTKLIQRLDIAINIEKEISPVGMAFVKLSTRSPKDSKKALKRATVEYERRIEELLGTTSVVLDDNTRWRILCEETTRSSAVSNGTDAVELLLDSERVYEDLEYALRGPPATWTHPNHSDLNQLEQLEQNEENTSTSTSTTSTLGKEQTLKWNMSLVARAWDPRLTPESEFRGICWDNKLTCLCQYFHPLLFPELSSLKNVIATDIANAFNNKQVKKAVARLGGHCIIDFAWLEPGQVLIVELNPFDGVCLGTFPASTGLFLWDDPEDRKIMMNGKKGKKGKKGKSQKKDSQKKDSQKIDSQKKESQKKDSEKKESQKKEEDEDGNVDFVFRVREVELSKAELKSNCNPQWRDIIYPASNNNNSEGIK